MSSARHMYKNITCRALESQHIQWTIPHAMSVLYYKGHFILGAEFSESYQESCLSILNKLSPPINDGKSLYLFLLRLTGSVSMRCIPMLELRWGCARLSSPWWGVTSFAGHDSSAKLRTRPEFPIVSLDWFTRSKWMLNHGEHSRSMKSATDLFTSALNDHGLLVLELFSQLKINVLVTAGWLWRWPAHSEREG